MNNHKTNYEQIITDIYCNYNVTSFMSRLGIEYDPKVHHEISRLMYDPDIVSIYTLRSLKERSSIEDKIKLLLVKNLMYSLEREYRALERGKKNE